MTVFVCKLCPGNTINWMEQQRNMDCEVSQALHETTLEPRSGESISLSIQMPWVSQGIIIL